MEREKEIIFLKNWIECLVQENKRLKSEINEFCMVKNHLRNCNCLFLG